MKKIILLIMCLLFCSISTNAQTIIKFKGDKNSIIRNYKLENLGKGKDGNYKYKETFKIEGIFVDKNNEPIVNKKIAIASLIGCDFTTTNSNGKIKKTFCFKDQHNNFFPKDIMFISFNFYIPIKKYKESLKKGEYIYNIPNPIMIIYPYPFDKFKKIIPYDKNDDAQLIEIEDSKSNVIVLDTIDLSAEYFRDKINKEKEKQNIINEARKMLWQEEIYDDVNKLIIEVDGSIKENWKEIIELKIKEVLEERKQKERDKKNQIKRWKNDSEVHIVQQQLNRCPNCYRYSLQISLLMKTGDPNHTWLMMWCPQCEYYNEELSGF